jgi:hypothetical protein
VSELEQRLTQLARELDWPETPDLRGAVTRRLAADSAGAPGGITPPTGTEPVGRAVPPRVRRPIVLRRSLVIALAALLVLAGGVFAAVPSVRDAVLEFFGLQGATVERREELPRVNPGQLRLGERTTLDAARDDLDFEPLIPEAAGEPDGVFVETTVPGGQLSLTYRPRGDLPEARSTGVGLLVDEFRGDLAPEYMGKIASQATSVDEFELDGEKAIWLEGAPHFFFYRTPDQPIREDQLRIAQNVLLLEHGRLLVRLEGAFDRERAIELARSLR